MREASLRKMSSHLRSSSAFASGWNPVKMPWSNPPWLMSVHTSSHMASPLLDTVLIMYSEESCKFFSLCARLCTPAPSWTDLESWCVYLFISALPWVGASPSDTLGASSLQRNRSNEPSLPSWNSNQPLPGTSCAVCIGWHPVSLLEDRFRVFSPK